MPMAPPGPRPRRIAARVLSPHRPQPKRRARRVDLSRAPVNGHSSIHPFIRSGGAYPRSPVLDSVHVGRIPSVVIPIKETHVGRRHPPTHWDSCAMFNVVRGTRQITAPASPSAWCFEFPSSTMVRCSLTPGT